MLENNKIETSVLKGTDSEPIDNQIDLLVVAGPRYDFRPDELKRLETFVDGGGRLLVLLGAMIEAPNLIGFLKKYGLVYNSDIVLLDSRDPQRINYENPNFVFVSNFDAYNDMTKDFFFEKCRGTPIWEARSIDYLEKNEKSFAGQILAKSSPRSERFNGVKKPRDLAGLSLDPATRQEGEHPLMVYANRKNDSQDKLGRESMIVALGTGEFASNQSLGEAKSRFYFKYCRFFNWRSRPCILSSTSSVRPSRCQ